MSKALVQVRFDVVKGMTRDRDQFLAICDLPEVPLVGELVNVLGNPYYVVERNWAVGYEGPANGRLFAFLRLR